MQAPTLRYQAVPCAVVAQLLSLYSTYRNLPIVLVLVGMTLVVETAYFTYPTVALYALTIGRHPEVYDGDDTAPVSNVVVAVAHVLLV